MAEFIHQDPYDKRCFWDRDEKVWRDAGYALEDEVPVCTLEHPMAQNDDPDYLSDWRKNRERGFHKEIGWAFQNVLSSHRYDYSDKGSKTDDPGWHVCTCRHWEGYWSAFDGHVTNYLREVALERFGASQWQKN